MARLPPARKIIHVDMDAFYAAVEQRDRPELRGLPVIVGGSPKSRGVVCTASYEARKFGVHSAMASAQAFRLCPEGIFLPPDFTKYAAVASEIREIFQEHTDLVEPLSLDEAYLDVTVDKMGIGSATRVAEEIRRSIHARTRLTASAGVAPNKFLAKVASDLEKPDGLVVILPEDAPTFAAGLPVRKIPGIGKKTEALCHRHGIRLCGDFLRHPLEDLHRWFGSSGGALQDFARGIDERPVVADGTRKSVGIEDTFPRDLLSRRACEDALRQLAGGLDHRLQRADVGGRTVTLKVKYGDFQSITRSRTGERFLRSGAEILPIALELLGETEVGQRPVRLLGIAISSLDMDFEARQLLFPFEEPSADAAPE